MKIASVFGCTLAVVVITSCSEGEQASAPVAPSQALDRPVPEPACSCMCGDNDPSSPRYNCLPEWYSCGRDCHGGCDAAGQDTYVCGMPNEGTTWAPPNCVWIGFGCEPGTARFCCGCSGPPGAVA